MKTKLRTFAHKQILRGKHNAKPVDLYIWKHIIITFSVRFYDIFFVCNIIQISCFFFLHIEKNSWPLWAK